MTRFYRDLVIDEFRFIIIEHKTEQNYRLNFPEIVGKLGSLPSIN